MSATPTSELTFKDADFHRQDVLWNGSIFLGRIEMLGGKFGYVDRQDRIGYGRPFAYDIEDLRAIAAMCEAKTEEWKRNHP
jgi:hypothetical protein